MVQFCAKTPLAAMKSAAAREAMERRERATRALTERREELREKLQREEHIYALELAGKRTSAGARRADLEARARALLEKREEERLKYVEDMEYKRWLETDAQAREAASLSLAQQVELGRRAQIQEHARSAVEEEERKCRLNITMAKHWAQDAERARRLDAEALAGRKSLAKELEAQLNERENERRKRLHAEQEERAQLKRQWEIQAAEINAAQSEDALRRREIHLDMLKSNAERQVELFAALERERAYDAQMLADALENERIVDAEHAELAQRRREEEALYAQYLQDFSRERDAQCRVDEERIENERVAHERRQENTRKLAELARMELMQECVNVRARQIKEIEEKRARKEEEEREWRIAQEGDFERANKDLEENLKAAKIATLKHKMALEEQIRDKKAAAFTANEHHKDDFIEKVALKNAHFAERFARELSQQNAYLF